MSFFPIIVVQLLIAYLTYYKWWITLSIKFKKWYKQLPKYPLALEEDIAIFTEM